ncbi:hypothetical protein Btru_032895 [Bulinus truncatus]|nr:hypothetical protein Btru_032895 [Bulinus truncatus]
MDPNSPFPPSPREMYMYSPPQMNGHSTPTKDRALPTLPERNPETQLGKRMSSTKSSKSSRGSISSDRSTPPPSPGSPHLHQKYPPAGSPQVATHHSPHPHQQQQHQQQQQQQAKRAYQENKPFSYAVGILNPKQAAQLHHGAAGAEDVLRSRDASPHNGRHQVKSETLTVAEDYARFMHHDDSVFQDQAEIYQRINGRERAVSAPNGVSGSRGSYGEDKGSIPPTNGSQPEGIYGKFVPPGNQSRPKLTYVPPPVVPPLMEANPASDLSSQQQQLKQQKVYGQQQLIQQKVYGQQQQQHYTIRQPTTEDIYNQQGVLSTHSGIEAPPSHYQQGLYQQPHPHVHQVQPCCHHASSPRAAAASPLMSPKTPHKKRSVNDPCPPLPNEAPSASSAVAGHAPTPYQLPSRHSPSPPPPPPPPPPPLEQTPGSRSSLKRNNTPSPTPLALHSQYYDTSHSAHQNTNATTHPTYQEVITQQQQHAQPYAQHSLTHGQAAQSNGKQQHHHHQAYVQPGQAYTQPLQNHGHPSPCNGQSQHQTYGHHAMPHAPNTAAPASYHHTAHQHPADQPHRAPPSFVPPPPAPPPPPGQLRDPHLCAMGSPRLGSPAKVSHQRQASAATMEQLAHVKLRTVSESSYPTSETDESGSSGINVKLRPTPGKFGNIYVDEETTLPPPPPLDDLDELPPPPPPPELLAHDVSGLSLAASVHAPSSSSSSAPTHHVPAHQQGAAPPAPPQPHLLLHHCAQQQPLLAGEVNSSQIHQQHPAPPCPPQHQAGTNKHSGHSGDRESENNTSSLERLIAESVANMDFEIPDDIDLTQCPGLVEINKHTPNWKKDMIEKKNQEKIEEYVKNILRQREQEAKWKNVPEWKRKILQKKEEEEQTTKTAPPEKEKKPVEQQPTEKEKKVSKKAPVPAPPPKDDFVPPKPKGDIVPAALSIDPEELAAMPPWKRELLFKRDKVPITFSNEFNPEDEDGSAQGGENSDAS